MKAVIIVADGPEHRFVSKCLEEALGNHLSGIVIERRGETSSLTSLKKTARRYGSLKKTVLRYGVFRAIERFITKLVRKFLRVKHRKIAALHMVIDQIPPKAYMSDKLPRLEVKSANTDECIKWIEDIKPDYIFVYGTGIIGKKLLLLPSLQTINLHTGISPYYRGSSCAFWPLYNKEPQMVGSTVHKCTQEIDGGSIYGRVSVRLSEDDDPYIAFAKSVKAGAYLYSKIARGLINGEVVPSKKQDFSIGKEYRFTDYTFIQEIIMEYQISSGKLKKMISDAKNTPLPFP